MKLSIVIPAYNEENAIASIIERCLAARRSIIAQSDVTDVEVTVVSDGSTDRTADIAGEYDDINLIVFEKNRGYGAAIKRGFEESGGDLVGFLDADGTCDPNFFATLATAIVEDKADVAIGSRLGPQSRMPGVRRLGNRIYAVILSALSNKVVSDTASGMRVIRRDALRHLYPLPDGLHFTPAMSARVLMDEVLTIVERPMTYEERIGESKLSVVRDGVRFLRTIIEMTLMWRPVRLFAGCAILCLAVMTLLALHPIESWLRTRTVGEGMIYRLLFCSLLGCFGVTLLSGSVIVNLVSDLVRKTAPRTRTFTAAILDRLYSWKALAVMALVSVPLVGWLVGPGVGTWVSSGYVAIHWTRVVLAGLIVFALGQVGLTVLIANLLRFHIARRNLPEIKRITVGARRSKTITGMVEAPAMRDQVLITSE